MLEFLLQQTNLISYLDIYICKNLLVTSLHINNLIKKKNIQNNLYLKKQINLSKKHKDTFNIPKQNLLYIEILFPYIISSRINSINDMNIKIPIIQRTDSCVLINPIYKNPTFYKLMYWINKKNKYCDNHIKKIFSGKLVQFMYKSIVGNAYLYLINNLYTILCIYHGPKNYKFYSISYKYK